MNLLVVIILWRILLFIIAFLTQKNFLFIPEFPYSDIYLIPSGLPNWIWSWANFDGVHYLTIALRGYFAQFTQVFFPLYPLILRLVGKIFFDQRLILSGLSLSFFTFVIGNYYFIKLLKFDYKFSEIKKIIIFLLIFPTSFYFASLYTESLFLLFVILSFFFARQKRWWLCGICGMFASATRITGIFLLPALLWEWKINNNKNKKTTKFQVGRIRDILLVFKSPIFFLVPLGLLTYMVYLQIYFHDALFFWHAQSVFGAERSGAVLILPLQVIWRYAKILFSISIENYQFWSAFWELSAFFFAVIILFIAHLKKVRFSYLIFSWLVVMVPSLTGTLSSLPRYILLAFPIYIVLGLTKNKKIIYALALLFIILLILFTSNFVRGKWVA